MTLEKQKSFEDSPLWKLKVRLQFSGWLQYIAHAILILIMLIIAGIGWLVGYWSILLFWIPLAIATFLSIALIGTVIIVKYGIHPTERIPADKNDLDAFDLMRARHSCRSFQSRNLTPEHHTKLMEAVKLYSQQDQLLGQQPVRFDMAFPEIYPISLQLVIFMLYGQGRRNGQLFKNLLESFYISTLPGGSF